VDRRSFRHGDLTLSYLDAGGQGPAVVALPAHWMEARTYAPLAAALAPDWRVVALDQRGHGFSDRATRYDREDYLGDALALCDHLGLRAPVLLGSSLGGVNAYQLAARHPDRVRGLVVEDIGAVLADDQSFVLAWAGLFPTRGALAERVGPRLAPYLAEAFRETRDGWRLAFEPADMVASQRALNGDHWADWLASRCPALLVRGGASRLTTAEHLAEMAARRPGTRLLTLDAGHVVHADAPGPFAEAVRGFLRELDASKNASPGRA
jgi:pimeloyl-ACP methyl ester carboxylesterase